MIDQRSEPRLGSPQGLVGLGQPPLGDAPVGEIGKDHGSQEHAVEVKSVDRQQNRNGYAIRSGQVQLSAGVAADADVEQLGEPGAVGPVDQVNRCRADQILHGPADHRAQPGVGTQDQAPGGDGGRPVVHRLDDQPVGAVGASERVDPLIPGPPDHQRVDPTAPDGLDRLVRLAQLRPHLGELGGVRRVFPRRSRRVSARTRGAGRGR